MNTSILTHTLHINETIAIHAWRENRDEAAGRWLLEKYLPVVVEISAGMKNCLQEINRLSRSIFTHLFALLEKSESDLALDNLLKEAACEACAEMGFSIAL